MSTSLFTCERIRNGQPITAQFAVVLQDDNPELLPTIHIFTERDARRGGWKKQDTYELEEIVAEGGRAFLLHRSAEAIAKDAIRCLHEGTTPDERYGVFLSDNPQDFQCECRGFAAHSRCKHLDAIRHLITDGQLDDPRHDPRPEPAPDMDAMAAMMEAPF
jgi:hypothetical protein